ADKVFTSPETEALLGLKRGTLEGPAAKWLEVLHPLDQDRFRAALDIGDDAGGGAAAGEGVLHHRKANEHHDQHQAAEQRGTD
ncbi:PAS domain-containing protein, partial [Bradyrhizobium uaiense]|uniref:PAS domain-containing protein n=1 Tax=Bradyrhizobium uaiense TaxID=2594946 RepID=UPI001F3832F6